jgi:hypothetical protein
LRIDLGERIKLRVDLVLGDGALVSNKWFELTNFLIVLSLKVLDVLFWNLNVTLQLKHINQKLTLICELILVVLDKFISARLRQIIEHVEEHSVLVGLFHYLSYLNIKVIYKSAGRVVNDLVERLKTDTALSNIAVKQANTNNDVRKFTKLSNLFRCGQGDKRPETSAREDGLESSGDLTLNSVAYSVG